MSNEIKRYDQWVDEAYQETPIVECEDGQFCIYEDIKPIIEELRNKIMILEDDNCMLRGQNKDLTTNIIWYWADMKDMSEQIEKDQAEITRLKKNNDLLENTLR
jgi:SMC interacting uncharacterized protein involved in chromosome segregation